MINCCFYDTDINQFYTYVLLAFFLNLFAVRVYTSTAMLLCRIHEFTKHLCYKNKNNMTYIYKVHI